MIFELRTYRCMPGRKADVLARFRNHTMRLFEKHGLHVVGFWETLIGETDELIYMIRFRSWEDRGERWGAFAADPEWQQAAEQSNARGQIVEHVRTALLDATDFSPAV